MSKNIIITGARGAIGVEVVRQALAAGHRVAGLGHGAWSGSALPAIHNWVQGSVDLTNLTSLASKVGTPDAIIHLAGGSLVGASLANPGEDFLRTVSSAHNTIDWIRLNAPEAKLVIASSAAVYGAGHSGSIVENSMLSPASPYGVHKHIVEIVAQSRARHFGLNVAVLRPFSVYGPGLLKQLVYELMHRMISSDNPIILGGTGDETRDFIHVTDAASMLLTAVDLANNNAPVFNLCTGRATTIRQLATIVSRMTNSSDVIFSGVSRVGDPEILVGNPSCAANSGLEASVLLDSGLKNTLDWILLK